MSMQQAAMRELARRELARRQQAQQAEPTIIEEQHDGISDATRFKVKSFSNDLDTAAEYIKQQNPELETRVHDGRILARKQGENEYRVLDPDTGFFSTDILNDATDIAYDVGSGVVEGAALVGSGIATGGIGAVAGGAAAGAANEALRQKIGEQLGINKDINGFDVALTGAISGGIPLAGKAIKPVLSTAKNTVKGGVKFLTGLDDKVINRMQQEGAEDLIQQAERDTVLPMINEKQTLLKSKLDEAELAQFERTEELRKQLDLSDDDQVIEVLRGEQKALDDIATSSGVARDEKKYQELESLINDVEKTKQVRAKVGEVGLDDESALRSAAFPEAKPVEELMNDLPEEIGERAQQRLKGIREQYELAASGNPNVSLQQAKQIYKDEIDNFANMANKNKEEEAYLSALESDFNKRFKYDNTNYDPKWENKQALRGYAYGDYGDISKASNVKVVKREDGSELARLTSDDANINYTDKRLEFDELPYDRAKRIKDNISREAYSRGFQEEQIKTLGGGASQLTMIQQRAERAINDAMDAATAGGKKANDPEFVRIGKASEIAKKLFKDTNRARVTIEGALKDKASGVRLREEISMIDDVLGTNYTEVIEKTAQAMDLTKRGMKVSKTAKDSGKFFSSEAEKTLTTGQKLLKRLKQQVKDPEAFEGLINKYKRMDSKALNADIDKIDAEFGEGAGRAVKDIVEDFDLIAAFGDSEKTLLSDSVKGQASNTARGITQSVAWGVGGAGGAQIGGAIGKAVGDKLPIKAMLRKRLPQYIKGKKALMNLDEQARKELEKKIGNTMIRRADLLRESLKTAIDVGDSRG